MVIYFFSKFLPDSNDEDTDTETDMELGMEMELFVNQQKLNELKDAIELCYTIKVREMSSAVEKHVEIGSNPLQT